MGFALANKRSSANRLRQFAPSATAMTVALPQNTPEETEARVPLEIDLHPSDSGKSVNHPEGAPPSDQAEDTWFDDDDSLEILGPVEENTAPRISTRDKVVVDRYTGC